MLASTDPSGAVVARYELGPVLLDGSIVQHAEAVQSQATQQWQVNFTMTPSGSKSFDAMASGHYHQMIAMVVDDNVISAPEINAVRFHGAGQISGALTETGARQLADILNTPG